VSPILLVALAAADPDADAPPGGDAPPPDDVTGDDSPSPDVEPAFKPAEFATDDPPPDAPARGSWGGIVLPLVAANSTDGLGFGLGGEVFHRHAGQVDGYHFKVTPSGYLTVSGAYQSYQLQTEWRGPTSVLLQTGWSLWKNLLYAGHGGHDLVALRPPGVEIGNRLSAPFATLAVSKALGSWALYGQLYARTGRVTPNPGGLLDQERPDGATGGSYVDLALGAEREDLDRWPLPNRGTAVRFSTRGGFATPDGRWSPIAGAHFETIGWTPLGTDHLVLGGRFLVDGMVGQRPFFTREILGGRFRDELAYEQALSGYARLRPRGDAVVAGMVELRPYFGRVKKGFFDLGFYASVFAEQAWLFDGTDPGPPLPTVGVGPELVWQGATQLRPWIAWGWRDDGTGPRRPVPQFGLSLRDPL
jgi:hypothetical protein